MIVKLKKYINAVINKPTNWFLIIAGVSLIIQFIMLFATGGTFIDEIIWDGKNGNFVDFGAHVARMMDGIPYDINDWDARFPPLAYLFYGAISRLLINTDCNKWILLYMVMLLVITLCIWFSVIHSYNLFPANRTLFFCCILLLSHPYLWAAFKAANAAFYVLVLLMAAMLLRESEKKFYRELALILIALAAGLKIAPAIFGLLYIKEKRYAEAGRLIIYGIIFFFVPFFFVGGLESAKIYLEILGKVTCFEGPRPETIIGVFIEGALILGKSAHFGWQIGRIVSYIFLFFVIVNLLFNRLSWKSIALLSSSLVVVVNLCYPYTLVYFTIPLILFIADLNKKKQYSLGDYIYAVLFAMIFTTYPFLKINWPTATFITNYFWVYIFLLLLTGGQIIQLINRKIRRGEPA